MIREVLVPELDVMWHYRLFISVLYRWNSWGLLAVQTEHKEQRELQTYCTDCSGADWHNTDNDSFFQSLCSSNLQLVTVKGVRVTARKQEVCLFTENLCI